MTRPPNGTLAKFGVKTGKVELDLAALQGEKAGAVKELTGGIEFLFKKNKVDWLKGYAPFKDAHTVEVAGKAVHCEERGDRHRFERHPPARRRGRQ